MRDQVLAQWMSATGSLVQQQQPRPKLSQTCGPVACREEAANVVGAGERCSSGGTKQPKALATKRRKRLVRCCIFCGNTTLLQQARSRVGRCRLRGEKG